MPFSEGLRDVMGPPNGVLAKVSGQRASIRIAQAGGTLSPDSINRIKNGIYGEPEGLRTLARAYSDEISQQHGHEVSDAFGSTTPETVQEWVVLKADPKLVDLARLGRPDTIAERTRLVGTVTPDPEDNEDDDSVKGWATYPQSDRFRDVWRRLIAGRDLRSTHLNPEFLTDINERGYIPPESALLDVMGKAGLSVDEALDLWEAAGYGPWDPRIEVAKALTRSARVWGAAAVRGNFSATDMDVAEFSPKQLLDHLERIEKRIEESVFSEWVEAAEQEAQEKHRAEIGATHLDGAAAVRLIKGLAVLSGLHSWHSFRMTVFRALLKIPPSSIDAFLTTLDEAIQGDPSQREALRETYGLNPDGSLVDESEPLDALVEEAQWAHELDLSTQTEDEDEQE